jgi:hypothetical protein
MPYSESPRKIVQSGPILIKIRCNSTCVRPVQSCDLLGWCKISSINRLMGKNMVKNHMYSLWTTESKTRCVNKESAYKRGQHIMKHMVEMCAKLVYTLHTNMLKINRGIATVYYGMNLHYWCWHIKMIAPVTQFAELRLALLGFA